MNTTSEMFKKLEKALKVDGGLYSAYDIIDAVKSGSMQGFVLDDNWVVTQVFHYPQKTILHIVVVVGEMDKVMSMYDQVVEFAKEQQVDMISTLGRRGWEGVTIPEGWSPIATLFVKEMV